MRLFSPAFENGEFIPVRYTCDGENVSPPLLFLDPPPETESFALLIEDPDAPVGTFTHWLVYDVPADFEGLAEDLPPAAELEYGIKQGVNDFGQIGYGGPCPPPGNPHRYFFTLFALTVPTLGIPPGATRDEFLLALKGKVLAQDELVGLYSR
jgi:Raf kinase inhibitor-like YbhB/YbcL family protein